MSVIDGNLLCRRRWLATSGTHTWTCSRLTTLRGMFEKSHGELSLASICWCSWCNPLRLKLGFSGTGFVFFCTSKLTGVLGMMFVLLFDTGMPWMPCSWSDTAAGVCLWPMWIWLRSFWTITVSMTTWNSAVRSLNALIVWLLIISWRCCSFWVFWCLCVSLDKKWNSRTFQ